MALGNFTIGGLISGYKTDDIVAKLIDGQKGQLKSLQGQLATNEAKTAAYRDLNTKILALKLQTVTVGGAATYNAAKATSGNESLLTATASGSATAATYTLSVEKVAQAEQQISQGYTDATSSLLGTGTVTISLAGTALGTITVDSTNNSLNGLAGAINNAGLDVKASVINDGSGTNAYRLVLTSTKTGEDNVIGFSDTLSGGTAPGFSVLQAAQDAELKIGDTASAITVKSATNSFTSVIASVTLDVKKASPGTSITVNVAAATETIRGHIDTFIEKFNELADNVKAATFFDPNTNTAGILQADAVPLAILDGVVRKVSASLPIGNELRSLADIGITLDKTGHLVISDEDALDEALDTKLDKVKTLMSDSDVGVIKGLDKYLNSITEPATGLMALQDQFLTADGDRLQERIDTQNEKLSRQ
ncbi:MAG: hypothetical protein FJX76_22260, partial [Armatimonadetes bacterium]|nr:hypothetical protein [Armatimonadota bacterium]